MMTSYHVKLTITTSTPYASTPWPGPKFWKYAKASQTCRGNSHERFRSATLTTETTFDLVERVDVCNLSDLFQSLVSGILAEPPYSFSTSQIGLSFLSPFISAIPGAAFRGYFTDSFVVLRQAKKNRGIAKAEHKLKLYIIPTILTPIGLLMIGLGPYYGAHWIVYILGCFIVNLVGPLAAILTDLCIQLLPSYQTERRTWFSGMCSRCGAVLAFHYLISDVFYVWFCRFFFESVGEHVTANVLSRIRNYTMVFRMGFEKFRHLFRDHHHGDQRDGFCSCQMGKEDEKKSKAYYRKVINW